MGKTVQPYGERGLSSEPVSSQTARKIQHFCLEKRILDILTTKYFLDFFIFKYTWIWFNFTLFFIYYRLLFDWNKPHTILLDLCLKQESVCQWDKKKKTQEIQNNTLCSFASLNICVCFRTVQIFLLENKTKKKELMKWLYAVYLISYILWRENTKALSFYWRMWDRKWKEVLSQKCFQLQSCSLERNERTQKNKLDFKGAL